MLATGSELIEDVRKAPEDVLSMIEATNQVRLHAKRRFHITHMGHLARSTTIHARLVEF